MQKIITIAVTLFGILAAGCEPRVIPSVHLGERIFHDDFERQTFGENWQTQHNGWKIRDGWVNSTRALNKGLWLNQKLPKNVLIQFDARSETTPKGTFPGDIKCEVFATEQAHEAGYVLVNGGWNNALDIIARLDEHGKDLDAARGTESSCSGKCRKRRKANPVVKSAVYRYTVARLEGTIYWFRGNQLQMIYADPEPIDGHFFGFNNWESNVYFDNLSIWAMN